MCAPQGSPGGAGHQSPGLVPHVGSDSAVGAGGAAGVSAAGGPGAGAAGGGAGVLQPMTASATRNGAALRMLHRNITSPAR